ncbi:MAG: hypothetical protein JST00_01965 [Deltaproteobacteria bacterium]|nr:hypothetical protein [Deltaproteobacteria bacterium]
MASVDDQLPTVEGTSWPIVLFVELIGARAKEWSRALEEANIIVLSEGSILRAAFVVTNERPSAVLLPATLPVERTQVVRDAARDVGAEILTLRPTQTPAEVKGMVEDAIAAVRKRRGAPPR